MHFAIGIFYKAAVHSWSGGSTEPRISLGDDDTEALRLYLLGQANLPRHMALCIAVDSSRVIFPAMIEPYLGSNPDFSNYVFYVPGMVFHLLIGEGVQDKMAANCINSNLSRPVLVEELLKGYEEHRARTVGGRPEDEETLRDDGGNRGPWT